MTIGMAVVAPELVTVILGPKWLPSVGALRFIALFAGFRVISVLIGQVLTALRFTRLSMRLSLIALCVMPAAFWVAAGWSLAAVAAAWLLLVFVVTLPSYLVMASAIRLSPGPFLQALLPALSACFAMVEGLLLMETQGVFQGWHAAWTLGVKVIAGAALYGCVLAIFFRPKLVRYATFIRELRAQRQVV
jgi:O-antigen/teichoic acid export membrane protein